MKLYPELAEPRLYEFISGEPPASVQAVWDRFVRLEEPPLGRSRRERELWLNWVIKSNDREYVGLIEATVRNNLSDQLAYFVFVAHQGQGFGAAAVKLVIDHVVDEFDVTSARALVDTRNTASIRLLERLGFSRRRLIEHADHFKGSRSDEFEYVLELKQ
jgi:RimJ/RimL family protein N-acetyltransferase